MPLQLRLVHQLHRITLPLHIEGDGVSVSYSNNLTANDDRKKTSPVRYLWEKGKFSDLSLSLKLAVLSTGPITSAASLKQTVEKIGGMAMPLPGENRVRSTMVIIGNWFRIHGIMNSWTATFGPPWDEGGEPLIADVSFAISPTFGNRPPTAATFTFRW